MDVPQEAFRQGRNVPSGGNGALEFLAYWARHSGIYIPARVQQYVFLRALSVLLEHYQFFFI